MGLGGRRRLVGRVLLVRSLDSRVGRVWLEVEDGEDREGGERAFLELEFEAGEEGEGEEIEVSGE